MPGAVYLAGETATLRTIEEEDLPFLRDTINAPRVREYLGNRPPINLEQEREYFENAISDDENLNLLVCDGAEPAGTIGLHPRNPADGSSEIGLFLAEEHWGKGLGTDAARLVTDHAFREERHHRVCARVLDGNEQSRRVWEKLGFRHEATMQEAAFRDGEHVDVHWYAVLDGEWSDGE